MILWPILTKGSSIYNKTKFEDCKTNKYVRMKIKSIIPFVLAAVAAFFVTGCSTVDSAYKSAQGIGESAIGGAGKIVGSSTKDVGRTLGVATNAAGQLMAGAGKVVGGTLDVAGGLVQGTSEIVAPGTKEKQKEAPVKE